MSRTLLCIVAFLVAACGDPPATLEQSPEMLAIALSGEPGTLDPHQTIYKIENDVTGDLFLGLVQADPHGNLVPGAAKQWTVSEDGLTWTFDLREDLVWSDGKPIDAHDFLYSIRRYVAPATAGRYPFLLDAVENAEAVTAGRVPVEALGASVPSDDPYRLTLKLVRPEPTLLNILAVRVGYPVPAHVIEAHGKDWIRPEHWVSNGPYLLADWRPSEYIELRANPTFYDQVAIERFRYIPVASLQTGYNRFRTEELHVTQVPVGELDKIRREYPDDIRVADELRIAYLAFNTTRAPFNDVNVRKALAMAIDKQTLTQKILTAGYKPSDSQVPQWVAGYTPAKVPHADIPLQTRIAEASRLLEDAGYTPDNPLQVTLRFVNDGIDSKKYTVAIMGMWKAIGVDAQLQQSELKVHYNDITSRDFDVAVVGFGGGASPGAFLFEFADDDPSSNTSGYDNPDYNRLFEAARAEADLEKRSELWHQAEKLMLSDYPVAPLFTLTKIHLVSPSLAGWHPNLFNVHRVRYMSWREDAE